MSITELEDALGAIWRQDKLAGELRKLAQLMEQNGHADYLRKAWRRSDRGRSL